MTVTQINFRPSHRKSGQVKGFLNTPLPPLDSLNQKVIDHLRDLAAFFMGKFAYRIRTTIFKNQRFPFHT